MELREASIEDWDELKAFFLRIYRKNHPLQNREFWDWQYGNREHGRSFICMDQGEIKGHVGANFGGDIAWIINVYLDESHRGKGILRELYNQARSYFPLAATAANKMGLHLYRNMRWIRYYDLVRYVKINPVITKPTLQSVCVDIEVNNDSLVNNESHYFKQPGIRGIELYDGSRGVCQKEVGGFRLSDFEDVITLEDHAWSLQYNWVDYITSWNDLKCKQLEKNGWVRDYESVVPWRLNPIVENYFCDITFLSEKPLDNEFIVHRSFSDHGRVGSIKNSDTT